MADHTASLTSTSPPAAVVGHELTVVVDGQVSTVAMPVSGRLVIGRERGADVRVDRPRISRRHAVLHAGPGGFAIEDLGSSNGTTLNHVRLAPRQRAAVAPGDAVQLGDAVLLISPLRSAAAAAPTGHVMIAVSEAMAGVLAQLERVAPADVSVFILGETGVGKGVLARQLHERSPRRARPFLHLNCAALAEPLLESELFGHERGAFTGALQAKTGLLESAEGGTVFLDEIGELPERLQPKLLQALEDRAVMRVGSVRTRAIDIRFIAATNRDIAAEIAGRRFRADLYYRLSTFTLELPPLRERAADILPLAHEFVRVLSAERARARSPQIDDEAAAFLLAHRWPGNVRELRNVIERALVLAQGQTIQRRHLPRAEPRATGPDAPRPTRAVEPDRLALTPAELEERDRIIAALVQCQCNQSQAARALGISRTTLLHRLDAYRIARPRKRPVDPA
jgi:transcriptional regulator with PAS, ATPase and Fis domain